jgi:hypothetical protein
VTTAPRGLSLAGALLLIAGLGSAGVVVLLLGRQVAREREKTVRAQTDQQGLQSRLGSAQRDLKAAREEVTRLEGDRERRARAVEGEMATLRRDIAKAGQEREEKERAWRAAASERDRALDDLMRARREIEHLKDDQARALRRATEAEATAQERHRAAERAEQELAALRAREAALLRPLLQDLRSADGTVRVRAHEALCAWAGKDLPFRANGSDAERDADASAIEKLVLR